MLCLIAFSLLLPVVELSKDHTLYIVALAAYPDAVIKPSWDGGASLTPAARVAVEEINNDSTILPDYRLELIERDDGCDVTFKAVTSFVEASLYSGKQVVGMVGPGCSEAALSISELSTRDSVATLMVSIATTVKLVDRAAYPYTLRTVSTSLIYVRLYLELMKKNKWTKVAVLFDYYRTYFSDTFYKFRDEHEKRYGTIPFADGVTKTYFPLDALAQSHTRVILGFLGGELAPQLLCLAYHRKMYYPTYQWVFHDRSTHEFENGTSFSFIDKYCPGGICNCSGYELQVVLDHAIFCHYKLKRYDSDNTILISGKNFTAFFSDYNMSVKNYIAEKGLSDPIDLLYGPTYYDTVWSLARALDRAVVMNNVSLKGYWPASGPAQLKTTKTILARFYDEDYPFEGASGKISFSSDSGETSTVVEVFQLHNDSSRLVAQASLLGTFNGTSLSKLNGTFIRDEFDTKLVALNISVAVIFIVLLIAALVLTLSLHLINIIYRHSPTLKATSPKLNHLIFMGCYMIIAATMIFIVLSSFKSHIVGENFLCNAFWWLLILGFTIIFGIMISRLWRIYRIFTHFQDPGNLLSNAHLLGFVGLLVCISSAGLIIWMATDRLQYRLINSFIDINDLQVIEYWDCYCNSFPYWILAFLTFLGVLLGMMVTLAFLTRHVANTHFKYTKTTNILAYILGILLCIGFPIYVFSVRNPIENLTYSVMCIVLVGSVYLCNLLIILPPVLSLYKETCAKRSVHAVQNKLALTVFRSV